MCRFSLYLNTEKRLHHKRNDTDTIQELSPISKRIAPRTQLPAGRLPDARRRTPAPLHRRTGKRQFSPLPKSGLVRRKAMRHAALPLGNLSASKRTQRRLLHRPLYAAGDCETARRQTTLCRPDCRRAFVFFGVLLYEIRQETLRHVAQGLSQCRIQLNRFASAAAVLTS